MQGKAAERLRAGAWLLIVAAMVLVALLVFSSGPREATVAPSVTAPTQTAGEGLRNGPVPMAPKAIGGYGLSIDSGPAQPFGPEIVMARDGHPGPAPEGYPPAPGPTDAPFGADKQVTTPAVSESAPSIAGAPDGSIIIAYTNQTSPTNRDVWVARSTDGGATWVHAALAANAGYDEFGPRVIRHGTMVFVFFSHRDPSAPFSYRWAQSTNNGATWQGQSINFGSVLRDFINTDASSNGQWMYVIQEATCDSTNTALCPVTPLQVTTVHMYDATGAKSGSTSYHIVFDGANYLDLTEPAISVGSAYTIQYSDYDGNNPVVQCGAGHRDLKTWRVPTGQNAGSPWPWVDNYVWGICSTDRLRLDAAAIGWKSTAVMQYIDPAQGVTNHVIASFFNPDNGTAAGFTLGPVASQAGVEVKDPSVFASSPLMHASFVVGTNLGYSYSLNSGQTWQPLMKVNANTGTVVDAAKSTEVTYAGGVRVAWQDNRNGNDDIYYSTFSGYAFYIFDRNPSRGTVNVDLVDYPVPVAFLWSTGGTHDVVAPASDSVGVGIQLLFQNWSPDGNTNNARTLTVGGTDVLYVANYRTQYYLTMTAAVGTPLPGSGWQNASATVTISWQSPPPGPCVRYTFGGWTGTGTGSFTGPDQTTTITMGSPITEVADATAQRCYNIYTQPTGLQVTINGTTVAAPQLGLFWTDGSSNTVTAISPQNPTGPLERYTFLRWDDGTLTQTRTIVAGPAPGVPSNYTAVYQLEESVTIVPTPSDCAYLVDGTQFTTGQTFWFIKDSTHAVDVTSPQTKTADMRYVFASWSDGQPKSHTITASVPQTLQLTCTVEYRWQFDATPAGQSLTIDGTSLSMPQTNLWWASGSTHTVQFVTVPLGPDSQRVLQQWSDGSTVNPRTFGSIGGPGNYVAQTVIEYRWILDTNPSLLTLMVDGVSQGTPYTTWWQAGSSHSVEFVNINQPDTRTVFVRWSDGSTVNPRTFTANSAGTYTATVTAQYRFRFDTSPTALTLTIDGAQCTTPCPDLWWDKGTNHTVSFATIAIGADTRRAFDQWSDGDLTNPRAFNVVGAPAVLTLNTVLQYRYLLDTAPTGLSLIVDGNSCTAQCTVWFNQGSSHTVGFSQQMIGTDTRYNFQSWSDGSGVIPRTWSSVSGPQTLTVQTFAEFLYQFATNPALGIDFTVGTQTVTTPGTMWVREGSVVVATPAQYTPTGVTGKRYLFVQWSDGSTQASHTVTVSAPGSFTATYKTQYQLTVDTGGQSVTGTCSVADCWYDANTTAYAILSARTVPTVTGEQQLFNGWSGGATGVDYSHSANIMMDAAKTATATWKTQYLLTVRTDPAGASAVTITAGGVSVPWDTNGVWIDADASVTLTVLDPGTVQASPYPFVQWSDGTKGTTKTFTMSGALTLTAQYRAQSLFEGPLVWILLIIVIVVVALLLAFLLMRRRKQKPEAMPARTAGAPPSEGPEAPPAGGESAMMACPACGLTIPAKAGPCPICGAEVAPPEAPSDDARIQRLEEARRSGRITEEQYQANLKRMKAS